MSMAYRLMNYYGDWETRKQGVMLGANYYISGYLQSYAEIKDNGKSKQRYKAGLSLRDIRSDKTYVSSTYDPGDRKKRKRR